MAKANAEVIIGLRKNIASLSSESGAEALFDSIDGNTSISAAEKQRLQVELQTRVNEIQQGEIDKKNAAGDKAGADKILNRAEEPEVDPKTGKKLPSSRKSLRSKEEIDADTAERDLKPAHVPKGCESVLMTAEEAQAMERKEMELPQQERKIMGMKPMTDGRRDTPITKFLVIVKIALFLAFVLFPSVSFAALASDDVASMTDFTQTKGVKVNASGNLVPVTDSTYTIGTSGAEFSNGYFDALTVSGPVAFSGDIVGDGGDKLYGYRQDQVASTTTAITAAQAGKTFVSNSADVMTLPEASTVLGARYTFVCGTADDFDINPADGTDQISSISTTNGTTGVVTLAPAAGDAIRCTDIGGSITLEAIGNDRWAQVGGGNGIWTDVN